MSEAEAFTDFMRRLRAGDNEAAKLLVLQYEPLLQREVRLGIKDGRLHATCDPLDICQSVLASFFVRVAAGDFELDCPEQLAGLLVTMAHNQLASQARRARRLRRDVRRLAAAGQTVLDSLADHQPSPSDVLSYRELLEQVRASLTPEELQIGDLRGQGMPWEEIAHRLGGSSQARRMQLARALERVARQLRRTNAEAPA